MKLYGLAAPLGKPFTNGKQGYVLDPKIGSFATPKDVRLLLGHNPKHAVAETGVKLHLARGFMWFEVDLPQTELARDVWTLVNSGFLTQCSIGAYALDNRLLSVGELSLVLRPAWSQTWVAAAKTGAYGFWSQAYQRTTGTPCRPRAQLRHYCRFGSDRLGRILDAAVCLDSSEATAGPVASTLADVMIAAIEPAKPAIGRENLDRWQTKQQKEVREMDFAKTAKPAKPKPVPPRPTRSAPPQAPTRGSLSVGPKQKLSGAQLVADQLFGPQTTQEIRDTATIQNVTY